MLQSESQDLAQGVDAHGSHTSLNIQAGPPSYGSPGSSQQQQQPQCSDELGSSSLARKCVAAFDPGLADDVSQEQIDASDPQSSREGSQRFNLQGSDRDDREQQHAGTAGRGVQGQGAVGARDAAEPEHVGPALQELLVSAMQPLLSLELLCFRLAFMGVYHGAAWLVPIVETLLCAGKAGQGSRCTSEKAEAQGQLAC